jgi:hypothetical protein
MFTSYVPQNPFILNVSGSYLGRKRRLAKIQKGQNVYELIIYRCCFLIVLFRTKRDAIIPFMHILLSITFTK